MKKLQSLIHSFSKGEIILWSSSVFFILLSFFLFDRENYLTLAASLIGATSLIFCAKGNPFGQLLMMAFSILYGIVSFTFAYYGEMITYLGMTLPMAVFSFISWIRNPYDGNKSEVRVNRLKGKEIAADDCSYCRHNLHFLFYFGSISYDKPDPKHDFCGHKFPSCLSNIPPKCIFCISLCRQ